MSQTERFYITAASDSRVQWGSRPLLQVGETARNDEPRDSSPVRGRLAATRHVTAAFDGTWPYRLFAVCGTPAEQDYLRITGFFDELRVVEELDPLLMLGPNRHAVLELAGAVER